MQLMRAPERGVSPRLDEMVDRCMVVIEMSGLDIAEQTVRDTIYSRLVEFGEYPKKEGQDGSEDSEPGVPGL